MTAVVARYFPATIQLPDETRPRRRVYVLLARGGEHAGLHVWARPGEVADWHAPVDFERTSIPSTLRKAANGVEVHLADGALAVVTASAGCRCGALGHWSGPGWANTVAVRT